jgi:DNA-binding response OmpR family regulator
MHKILIIEDDIEITYLLINVIKLKCKDCIIEKTRSLDEKLLSKIKQKEYDLIILDLRLSSKMQGQDLLNELKKSRINVKVIVETAAPESIKEELLKKYPNIIKDVFLKPYEPKELINSINKLLK